MKRFLKWFFIVLLALVGFIFLLGWLNNESLPQVTYGTPEADQMAQKMLSSVNKAAWDSTRWVQWTFRSGTDYLWDKERDLVRLTFEEAVVLLHIPSKDARVWDKTGSEITDQVKVKEWAEKAWSNFANDSFWLCAPMKVFAPGTKRGIATMEDGSKGLLVTYTSGGVTPGDSYLWLLDDNNRPKAWRMWVQIIPVGGMEFSWEDWQGSADQPAIALKHHNSALDVPIIDLALETEIKEVNSGSDPFEGQWKAEWLN